MTSERSGPTSLETAVWWVRAVLAVLSTVFLVSHETGRSGGDWKLTGASVAGVAFAFAALSWFAFGVGRNNESSVRFTVAIQALDTVAVIGLIGVLTERDLEAAWVLMMVPIVLAAIRVDQVAVLGTWLVGSIGYGLVNQGRQIDQRLDFQTLLEQVGVLLAVAASVALLTRWLQEGWLVQSKLASEAQEQGRRMLVVGSAARAMRQLPPAEILRTAVSYIPELGFDYGVLSVAGAPIEAAGIRPKVAKGVQLTAPIQEGTVEITRWTGDDGVELHSTTVTETFTEVAISGWSAKPIDDSLALALIDLVAHASQAIEAARHLEAAQVAAASDPLTGLANRAKLGRALDSVTNQQAEDGVAVVFIDLDHFKDVNDTYGHLVGDRLLVSIAKRLKQFGAGRILAVRYGGDEFVILATGPEARDPGGLGESIRRVMAEPHDLEGQTIIATGSIGVAVTPATQVGELMRKADQAAYHSKSHGRNRVWVCRSEDTFEPATAGRLGRMAPEAKTA